MASIQLTGIGRTFKTTTAVDNVDLTICDGDFLVLLGPSGCGKTTLLRMIAGLLEPTSGRILLGGLDITDLPSKKRDLAMVFQSYALYPHLSVRKNLAFPLTIKKLSKSEIERQVQDVAATLEIGHLLDRKPRELSGGQRQRVAVGRALVRDPKAFLMDEPLSNLDAKLRTQTRRELTELHRRLGATFVYVTHDQVEAMTMATKIVVLNNGRIEQYGSPAEVYDSPASTFVASFVGSPATNLARVRISSENGQLRLKAPGISGDLWAGETEAFDVTLGIRPDHLKVGDRSANKPGVSISAVVSIVENLGNELIVSASVGDEQVQVRTSRDLQIISGDEMNLHADITDIHLFDCETGQRLEWVSEAPTPSHSRTLNELATV